jgi:Protein of unknown function (DUF2934)
MAKRAPQPDAEPKTRQKAARPARARAPKNGSNGELHPTPPNEDEIRIRAYHRYLERGAVDGGDFDDWVAAENELKVSHNA